MGTQGTRAEQRKQTRERIVEAAAAAFSDLGYHGASTREIAARAEANQGLITYYFRSKDELWKAAAGRIFSQLKQRLDQRLEEVADEDAREQAREAIRQFVGFVASHPELFRLMVEDGNQSNERMHWLVDERLRPMYEDFKRVHGRFLPNGSESTSAHAFYAMAGAASLIFAVAPECRRLTGLDPTERSAVQAHAEFLARIFVP